MRKLLFLVVLMIILTGCQSVEVIPDVWGQGEPPGDWQEFFGNENMARLNWVQTQSINNQGQAIAELAERVRKLEGQVDPDDEYEAELRRRGIIQ